MDLEELKKEDKFKEVKEALENDPFNGSIQERLFRAVNIAELISANNEQLPRNLNTDLEKKLHDSLTAIYRLCHTSTIPKCFDKHISWEKDFIKIMDDWDINEMEVPNEWKEGKPEKAGWYLATYLTYDSPPDRKVEKLWFTPVSDGKWYLRNGDRSPFRPKVIAYKEMPTPYIPYK